MTHTAALSLADPVIALNRVQLDKANVFYREAGPADAPAVLLLHGFPSSSHMYRHLIKQLATKYRVIAPDLPGFGFTEVAADSGFKYTFDGLTRTMAEFCDAVGLTRFAVYVFDYGAPVGFRLASADPEKVTAIISQNGNAYVEGLSEAWSPIQAYWKSATAENREALRGLLTLETTRWQYVHGTPDANAVEPESYTLDAALMARPGNAEIQLDLFSDYGSNVAAYPKFQAYFRKHQPPLLAIWGKNDPFFVPAGAEAFKRDNPNATVQMLDTGHFALETHGAEIAAATHRFLAAHLN